jgi:hypothetical protein
MAPSPSRTLLISHVSHGQRGFDAGCRNVHARVRCRETIGGYGITDAGYHQLPITRNFRLSEIYGRGGGVGRGLAVGPDLGVGVGRGVVVAVAVAVAVGLAVGVAVAVGVGVGVPPPTAAKISTRPQP